jgi:hypothetical protein
MKPSQFVSDYSDVNVIEYGDMGGRTGRQTSMSDFFYCNPIGHCAELKNTKFRKKRNVSK